MAVQSNVAPEVRHRLLPGKQHLQALASGINMANAPHQLPSLWHDASAAAATPPAQPAGSGHSSGERCSPGPVAPRDAPAAAPVAAASPTSAPHRALLWNKSAALPPLFRRPGCPAPASPTASCRSAPAALGRSLSIDHDSAAGAEVTSSPAMGFAASPAAATAPGTSQRQPALLLGGPADGAAAQAAAAFVKPLRLGSLDTVDLSIRPLDVTPPAHRNSAELQSAFSPGARAPLPGRAAFLTLGSQGPHNRLPAKAAWLKQAAAPRGGATNSSPCSSSAYSGYSALPAHTAAALAPPPAGQPAVDAAEVASKQVANDAKAVAAERRAAAIVRFKRKRAQRSFDKKVRYVSRKRLAESRPRVRGQFVKAGVTAACHALATQKGALGKAVPTAMAIPAM